MTLWKLNSSVTLCFFLASVSWAACSLLVSQLFTFICLKISSYVICVFLTEFWQLKIEEVSSFSILSLGFHFWYRNYIYLIAQILTDVGTSSTFLHIIFEIYLYFLRTTKGIIKVLLNLHAVKPRAVSNVLLCLLLLQIQAPYPLSSGLSIKVLNGTGFATLLNFISAY